MTRSRTRKQSAPEVENAPKEVTEAPQVTEGKEPVNIELETPSDEPTKPAEPASKEKVETDVRKKLQNKSTQEDAFVPSNPAALEKEAKVVADEKGFELNRGTSIGARLMARRRLS